MPPPPAHPSLSSPPSSPPASPLPPPPKHPSLPSPDTPSPAVQQKLQHLEDQEIAQLLARVGGQLTELRVREELDDGEEAEGEHFEWPTRDQFVHEEDGRTDWIAPHPPLSFPRQCTLTFFLTSVPPSLLLPASHSSSTQDRSFSLRTFRTTLERLYILLPPSSSTQFFFHTVAPLYRWDDPSKTGKCLGVYAALWWFDLLPTFPLILLIGALLRARLFPPSPVELLKQAEERRERTEEASELGRQLQSTAQSAGRFGLGMAAQGLRGVWDDIRERGRSEEEEKSLMSGLGSGALLGGLAGLQGEAAERLRMRKKSAGAGAGMGTSPLASPVQEKKEDAAEKEPAKGPSGRTDDVSLYRLAKNLSRSFGPQVQLWADDAVELGEGVKNILLHPHHPSVPPILLSLSALTLVLLLTPSWLLLKALWAYLGLEFFVLWTARERCPRYRRALMPWWWILHTAPTDAEYALWAVKQRSKEGKGVVRGSKTLKRQARAVDKDSGGVREKLNLRLPHRFSSSISSLSSVTSPSPTSTSLTTPTTAVGGEGEEPDDPILGTYFALHLSTPGHLLLTPSCLSFRPTRKLRHLGKLASRLSSPSSPSLDDASSLTSWTGGSSYVAGSKEEVEIRVEDVRGVKKEGKWMGRVEGLVLETVEGMVFRFDNVAKRDECFNKLLSVTSAKKEWELAG
ncbi:hypothetical protein JCM8547_008282 [Rhodosporidiobolus lusitaniae]